MVRKMTSVLIFTHQFCQVKKLFEQDSWFNLCFRHKNYFKCDDNILLLSQGMKYKLCMNAAAFLCKLSLFLSNLQTVICIQFMNINRRFDADKAKPDSFMTSFFAMVASHKYTPWKILPVYKCMHIVCMYVCMYTWMYAGGVLL